MSDLRTRLEEALGLTYRLERELGRGGMAVVWLAYDLRHRRNVAIKVLRPELAAAVGPDRFLREIETIARLTHPHILPLHDSGAANGLLFYVMPYIEGETLRQRLQRSGPLPFDEAVAIVRQLADALAYAHRQAIVHRDIKPENILLSDGHALLADFGIASAVTSMSESKLTETGIAMGTPAYMSPEQSSGSSSIDARSDIYALGCILYEILSGEPPLTGPTPQSIFSRRLHEQIQPLRTLRKDVPAFLERAASRMLARRLDDRFQTTDELLLNLAGAEAAPGGVRLPNPAFLVALLRLSIVSCEQDYFSRGARLSKQFADSQSGWSDLVLYWTRRAVCMRLKVR